MKSSGDLAMGCSSIYAFLGWEYYRQKQMDLQPQKSRKKRNLIYFCFSFP
jgi:hypothetical protein